MKIPFIDASASTTDQVEASNPASLKKEKKSSVSPFSRIQKKDYCGHRLAVSIHCVRKPFLLSRTTIRLFASFIHLFPIFLPYQYPSNHTWHFSPRRDALDQTNTHHISLSSPRFQFFCGAALGPTTRRRESCPAKS